MATMTLAPRPSSGTKGEKFLAVTNCFRISVLRMPAFHHYHVGASNEREIKNITRRRDIIKKLYIHDRPDAFQPGHVVFDGKAGLYASQDLGPDRDLHFELQESNIGPTVRVRFQKAGYISRVDFESFCNQEHQSELALTAHQILNLLFQSSTPNGFRRVEKKNAMYSLADQRSLGSGIKFIRGCFANVRLARDHLILNVDVCTTTMYESDRLDNVASRFLGSMVNLRPEALDRLLTHLKNVRVRQITTGKTGRVRSIKKFVAKAGFETFKLDDGTKMTVQRYNYKLVHPEYPGICVVKKDRSNENATKIDIIPFELLEVVEGQFYKRKLDPIYQSQLHDFSSASPEHRRSTIERYLQEFSPKNLASMGLRIDRNLLSIDGRILPPPTIKYTGQEIIPDSGGWKLPHRSMGTFHKPCKIDDWAVLCYDQGITSEHCMTLLQSLLVCLGYLGVQTYQLVRGLPRAVIQLANPQGDKLQHMHAVVKRVLKNRGEKELKIHFLLLVILPIGGGPIVHDQIKRVGDTVKSGGMVTQCLESEKLKKGLMVQGFQARRPPRLDRHLEQYLCNVILKINVKLGGINSVPTGNGLEFIHQAKISDATMVVGLDVSHPAPGSLRPSMASLVYSVDNYASRYCALCAQQTPRVEVIEGLREMFVEALQRVCEFVSVDVPDPSDPEKKRKIKIRYLPAHILVYRDGLSEGELTNVCNEEITAIQDTITDVWKGAPEDVRKVAREDVKITYVVVGKKHHIRFFPFKGKKDRRADNSGNCPSGFVTDDSRITHPRMFDFFLQSHAASRPAHYIVIKDDHEFSSDDIQSITFGLCHAFARSNRTVSIPAPVYYAHLICVRANIHIEYTGGGSEPGSVASGSVEYNPKDWEFLGLNEMQKNLMYFV
ncbi:Piwi-domain-containing protein [Fomitiporia mediterranea MF3/22]|uniref:Piwi-domain-containing protein n=1 Tax=Fomitiporia mediterranea (strain MF3/22) TaxID=694068 RepID=UPI0004409412|nr:Piwi-domain-containing protein [Fomitiporia mediterranea MF3/22]EJD04574.1 Piwi-domain-containing protein [Fomitiporia mediterranea MF3/22]